jgi:protein-S-isoprenylcysteine O-methyltransferase Ste14
MTPAKAAVGTAVFFFVAPGIVAGLVPWWITGWRPPEPLPLLGLPAVLGVVLLLPGLWVLIDSFVRFARNLGTPAPIAPTERLVVDGWYRYVRNPMYVGVLAIILGQALLFVSWPVLVYWIVAFVVVHLFVAGYEEPTLRQQFPNDYADYFANVPRWLPRLTPWRPVRN